MAPSTPPPSLYLLQQHVNQLINEKTVTPWHAPIPFSISKLVLDHKLVVIDTLTDLADILNPPIHSSLIWNTAQLYFSPEHFDPNSAYDVTNPSFLLLLQQLSTVCLQSGFCLSSSGCTKKGATNRRILCQQGRVYKGRTTTNTVDAESDSVEFRKSSFIDDRGLNSRSKGKTLPRRTSTVRPLMTDCKCSFSLTIKVCPINGFYLDLPRTKDLLHYNHRRISPIEIALPKRLLSKAQMEMIDSINSAEVTSAVARNVIFKSSQQLMTCAQVRYMRRLQGLKSFKIHPNPDNSGAQSSSPTDADRLISFIEEKNYQMSLLYQTKESNESSGVLVFSLSDVSKASAEKNITLNDLALPQSEQNDMTEYVFEHRDSLGLSRNEDLMIAVAWVVPSCKKIFALHPHVLFIDNTASTNKESRPHFTVSIQDSKAKFHVVFRAFLPHERAWAFRWLLQDAMPNLLGRQNVLASRLILSDGDSQETTQADYAIENIFCNARRRRCGFHIVTLGMAKHIPKKCLVSKKLQAKYESIIKQIKNWMYSWMRGSCENEEE